MNLENLKLIAETNSEKFLSEGTTTSLDNFLPNLKFSNILLRMYTSPFISMFGSILPVDKPAGTTFALIRNYVGHDYKIGEVKKGYADATENGDISQIDFKVVSRPVEFKTKKLKSKWTTEAIQDFTKMHANKPEAELNEVLSKELTNEIIQELDYEAFDMMYNAAKKSTWNLQTTIGTLYSFEIIQKITEVGLEMLQNTSYRCRVAVFCSKAIAGKLMAHPNFIRPFRDLNETGSVYYQGYIGNIDIYADVYDYGRERSKNNDYILIGLKDPTNGMNSSVLYFPYAMSMYTAPAKDDSSDTVFYNIFRYGLSLCAGDPLGEGNSKMLRFIRIGYREEPQAFPTNHSFYIGQIPTNEAFFTNYDKNPQGYDFTNDIKKTFTANQVVKMNQDEIQDTNNSFTYVLNKKDNFVYFAFETGQDNVKISTDLSFEEIFDYNIDFNKPYSIEADLGDGNKTYKIYVSKTPIQSVPNKLYMKSR